ncbi:MAG: TetR family transcriptional regulator [Calditrichaeota bacterium]|nr:TetR family transcriptional regulator [Calditrichota bacterium]
MTPFTNRQLKIIDSAIELIAREGIQKLTIKNLSAKVGVTEGAIYRHFKSKIDILLNILEMFKENTESLSSKIRQEELPPIQQLHFLFKERFQQFAAKPALAAVIFAEEIFQNDNRLSDVIVEIMALTQKIFKEIIEQGQAKKEIRDDISSEHLSMILLGSMRFMVAKWHLSGFSYNLEEEGKSLWESIKKMIKK